MSIADWASWLFVVACFLVGLAVIFSMAAEAIGRALGEAVVRGADAAAGGSLDRDGETG